jgi:hypothetical protein
MLFDLFRQLAVCQSVSVPALPLLSLSILFEINTKFPRNEFIETTLKTMKVNSAVSAGIVELTLCNVVV